ncbi:GNAT family N-acetyltransferase [Candidatus Frankia nodulisporulans]|uniref:GNAT family N-acetyltransferase n=1 Tax=Candidatus Frankia nodulisporulans TaxID=2060052 RepID=UPI0013D1B357|nr:acetyltransferase [Candidatus Frankia nodulisporulans]
MRTRRASPADWDAIWPVWRAAVVEGETCPWPPDTDEQTARSAWMLPPPADVLVMEQEDTDGRVAVVATALLIPSLPGLGDHVAQAILLVDPKWIDHGGAPQRARVLGAGRGRSGAGGGTGGPGGHWESASRLAAEQMIEYATDRGYRAMQLNAVISVNPKLVALWRSLAFRLVGTLPAAYRHPWLGDVDLYVMYRFLPTGEH